MEIDTQYAVRTFFPASTFTQVYFEAVANALDAGARTIRIRIETDGEIRPNRLELVVADDGAGFTDERFENFRRLQEPKDPYHKGLGRLVYLQYFRSVLVSSVSDDHQREFEFSDTFDGWSDVKPRFGPSESGTTLRFRGFRKERLRSYDDIKPAVVKQQLLDQFLPLLHSKKQKGEEFRISIELNTEVERAQHGFLSDDAVLTTSDVPDFEVEELADFELGGFGEVVVSYFIRRYGGEGNVLTVVSIDGRALPIRLVPDRPLPAGYSAIFLLESDLFQGRSDSSRQRLVLPDDIPQATLIRILRAAVASVLNREVPEIERRNKAVRQHFEDRYPHLVGLFDEDTVGVIDKDEAIRFAQEQFFLKQREVLEANTVDDEVFRNSLELSSRSLTEYILYREFIIKRLAEISADHKEEVVHNLIVPRYKRFEGDQLMAGIYSNNAWILDERFMTFRTILSEAKMQDVIEAVTLESERVDDDGRPDISLIFSADPNEVEAVDVVVVEVKRRTADDKEGPYAATQLIKRAEKLVEYCPNIQRMWYFGIIEMDNDVARLLKHLNWKPLFSTKGRIFYQEFDVEGVLTPTYLLSWDAVVEDAAARNHTFLEILKSDIRAHAR